MGKTAGAQAHVGAASFNRPAARGRAPASWGNAGGESGIRTHGTLAGTPDFESGTFGHSVISPRRNVAGSGRAVNVGSAALPAVCARKRRLGRRRAERGRRAGRTGAWTTTRSEGLPLPRATRARGSERHQGSRERQRATPGKPRASTALGKTAGAQVHVGVASFNGPAARGRAPASWGNAGQSGASCVVRLTTRTSSPVRTRPAATTRR